MTERFFYKKRKDSVHELTQSDYDILHAIENIVDGIAAMYGEHTEVLLHSLDVRNPSIIKIANGHVTGREVGAPITNLALMKLTQNKDISGAYMTKCPDGKTLRSMTTIIRNSQQQAIGLLCINSNLDAPFQSVIQSLVPCILPHSEATNTPETFARNNDEMMQSSIETVRAQVMGDNTIAPSKKSREIVTRLHDLGVFDLKDSAQIAAKGLDISIHTIYRYLRELKA
ncbi:PAS domain-containing protein [Photobacterium damselae subsp. damselae]|uniref:PAS domain-containing protein n=1 Tax=Photobacterium damselae subsp. damselae TaxID=85581 RepID=A0A7Y7Q618_PHODD|nr:PAS domain-containing protein [Photobacterium damselae]NVO59158.1 PAS domain-containing protein [Photobacterium damselae subsp. damselae]NVP02606.1 PAS domain-containing protein [Photobacterium damselae subsp. damselae]